VDAWKAGTLTFCSWRATGPHFIRAPLELAISWTASTQRSRMNNAPRNYT